MNSMNLTMTAALALLGAGIAMGSEPTNVTEHSRLARLPLGSVVAQGWLKTQLERSKAGMGGHLDELEPDMIAKPYVDRTHKSKVSPGWSGEISGTYWAGLVQLAFTLNDAELKAKAEKWVRATIALQEEDGYLGSYRKTDNRLEDYSAWSANWCYRALLAWYDATGEEEVLKAVHRSLLWYVKNWAGDQKTDYAGPTLMESMMTVYLKTGDQRLYAWCLDYLAWLDRHDTFRHGMASLQRPELQFNEDHVVAFGENVKHPALAYMAGGQPEYLAATRNGIRQIMEKCWQVTGAPVSNFEYEGPPSAIHETEYCNFATYLNTFSWMARITGEAVYGDYMERILFNGAQGARKKDDRAIAYNSAPNQFFATQNSCQFGNGASFGVYAPNFNVACCPAQSVRIYPEYIRTMFLRDREDNLYLPAYGPCAAKFIAQNGTQVNISEETLYPFDESVTLRVKASAPWEGKLTLKLPGWCKSYRLTLNGAEVKPAAADGWLTMAGTWRDDTLAVVFAMEPKVVAVNDVYFQKEPLRAVECGPLLFALKYKEKWASIPGTPLTPLPKEWSWFNVTCDGTPGSFSFRIGDVAKGLTITKKRCESDYPWEDSPLKLVVPMVRSQKHAYPYLRHFNAHKHTLLPYGNPVTPDEGAKVENIELVPFGCTVLRMACFTVCR